MIHSSTLPKLICFALIGVVLLLGSSMLRADSPATATEPTSQNLPPLAEVIASRQDLWAEAALRQPDGPSFEFFKALLPPLHYVNTDFRHYPIVLSAPNASKKSRLTANGSGINLRANTRAWNEEGTPVLFRVGNDELAYGEFLERLKGPKWAEGYLPVAQLSYHHATGDYAQETFASVDPVYASNAVSLTRFTYKADTSRKPLGKGKGRMAVGLETAETLKAEAGRIFESRGEKFFCGLTVHWKWQPAWLHLIEASFHEWGRGVCCGGGRASARRCLTKSPFAAGGFDSQRKRCVEAWQNILDRGMNIEVPEPYVNNAWRALLVANFSLIHGNSIHYSAGNAYDKLYEQEGGTAALAMLAFGYEADARRLLPPLLDFTRKGLEYHQAGHKLDDVCHYYWKTRDADFVRSIQPRWHKEIELLANHRSPTNGLYPREQYCGDIPTPVFSLNSNAKGWRALRDSAELLEALGNHADAERLRTTAADFPARIFSPPSIKVSTQSRTRHSFRMRCWARKILTRPSPARGWATIGI